jgi:hypothetical protein
MVKGLSAYTKSVATSFEPFMKPPVISPVMNSWHAEAAFKTPNHFIDDLKILKSCWGPMVDKSSQYYSGCHWELSNPDVTPHMGPFCSMAHPFSSLAVYQLSRYRLGLCPTTPGEATFEIKPICGFLQELEYVRGSVSTPSGIVFLAWEKESNSKPGIVRP